MLRRVDFPQPEGPSRQWNSPSAISMFTPSSATYRTCADSKTLRTLATCSNTASGRAQDMIIPAPRDVRVARQGSQRSHKRGYTCAMADFAARAARAALQSSKLRGDGGRILPPAFAQAQMTHDRVRARLT